MSNLYSEQPANLLDIEDLLQEILLRLPPQPSSIPCASAVCKCWRSILSDPRFICRFRLRHHRNPPLLGYFKQQYGPVFTPTLDSPDRIDAACFALPGNLTACSYFSPIFLGCRDGIALFLHRIRCEAILWNPITRDQRRVLFPPRIKENFVWSAAAVVLSDNHHHVQTCCHLSSFKLVLLWHEKGSPKKAYVCLYESRSGAWGESISTETRDVICFSKPSIVVQNALHWLLSEGDILEFDLETHALAVIKKPYFVPAIRHPACINKSFQILRGENNDLGLAVFSNSERCIRLWGRKLNSKGVVSWMLQNTVQLIEISQPLLHVNGLHMLVGYDEATNVIFLSSIHHDFILQLVSMQFRYLGIRSYTGQQEYYPLASVYTGVRSTVGCDCEAENVNT